MTISILGFHFDVPSEARGVTDPVVGCTGWFGGFRASVLSTFDFHVVVSVLPKASVDTLARLMLGGSWNAFGTLSSLMKGGAGAAKVGFMKSSRRLSASDSRSTLHRSKNEPAIVAMSEVPKAVNRIFASAPARLLGRTVSTSTHATTHTASIRKVASQASIAVSTACFAER